MRVDWKDPADEQLLADRVRETINAKQRDRYRVVLIAGQGLAGKPELEREEIAAAVGRSRQFVDQWVGRYRRSGIEALVPKRQPGAKPKLTVEQQRQLCAMLDAGPEADEGLAAYNGPILREKIERLFGQVYSLNGVYALLHRLGYNDLMPRPNHPETDPTALEAFKKRIARTSGSNPIGASRQAFADVFSGRGSLRPARNDLACLGAGGFAAAGNPADAIRLSVRVQRGLSGNWRGGRPDQSAHQHRRDERVPETILPRTPAGCSCGDGAGPGELAHRQLIGGSGQCDAGAFAAEVAGVESGGEFMALPAKSFLVEPAVRDVG
jgi:transposase